METIERTAPRASGYADVNGLHMYYEAYGRGSPLVLLHGGMMTIDLNHPPSGHRRRDAGPRPHR
jgi:pimeloyl-ACP methyl ester carboxylesterase